MISCSSVNSPTLNRLPAHQVSPQLVAEAIASVISMARNQGQTLEDLVAEILAEDPILDQVQRRWLSKIIIQGWENLPSLEEEYNPSTDNHLNVNYRDTSTTAALSTS